MDADEALEKMRDGWGVSLISEALRDEVIRLRARIAKLESDHATLKTAAQEMSWNALEVLKCLSFGAAVVLIAAWLVVFR